MMDVAPMERVEATCLGDVVDALADGHTAVLAGGQSLWLDPPSPLRRVVDINTVPEFGTLAVTGEVLRVGPLVRHRTFEADVVGGPLGELLGAVVRCMGHPPVRARGTMLGTLAYAHPAAEWPVVAVLLGAELDLVGPDGRRTVPADRFYTGPFATVRRPEELLAEARLPVLPHGIGTGYAEERRVAGGFAVAATLVAVTAVGDVVTEAAIGLVNAGPGPVRARAAEQALVGNAFSDAAIIAAARAAAQLDAAPDRRSPLIQVLTRRALTQARGRISAAAAARPGLREPTSRW